MARPKTEWVAEWALPTVEPVDRQAALIADWESRVPGIYARLGVDALPAEQVAQVTRWWTSSDRLGCWLAGPSWRGKTATMVLVVARLAAEAGHRWEYIKAGDYLAATKGLTDQVTVNRVRRVPVLLLDEWPTTLTPHDVEALRLLLSARAEAGRRTVVSANGGNRLAGTDPATEALSNRVSALAQIAYTGSQLTIPSTTQSPAGHYTGETSNR